MKIAPSHRAMVADPYRTPLIEKAIRKTLKKGDVVFDLGCGLGVLTLMALKAGAQKVYAAEIDKSILKARQNVARAGFSEKVSFFHGLSSDFYLPEKTDLLLAETVGSLGFDENILPFVIDARNRFLKRSGKIIPSHIRLFIAPYTPVRERVIPQRFMIDTVTVNQLMANPILYANINLKKVTKVGIDRELTFKIEKNGILGGFAGWTEIHWAPGIVTYTSPFHPLTHWKQGLLPAGNRLQLKKGDRLLFRLRIGPKKEFFATQSTIEWGFKIG